MHRDIKSGSALRSWPQVRAGRSVIAVIGIDQYTAWPRLNNAVNDAKGAARLFTRLGFVEITPPLIDGAATGEAMRRLVTDDLAQLTPDDSLVVFFAGHGHTHTAHFGDVSVKTGYVIPVDAVRSNTRAATWLRLDGWLSDIARLPPRHILVIIDACRSGVALGALVKWRNAIPAPTSALDDLRARRSRRIITSALDDQRAMDSGPYPGHSLFTGCLIEGLSSGLAGGGRRVATGSEIGLYLQQRVSSYPMSTQTPDFGALELDDRGEIVVPILSANTEHPEPEPMAPPIQSVMPQMAESAESAASMRPRVFSRSFSKTSRHARPLPATALPAVPLATPFRLSDRAPDSERALVASAATLPTATSARGGVATRAVLPNKLESNVVVEQVPPPPSRMAGTASWSAPSATRHSTRSRANMARAIAVTGAIAVLIPSGIVMSGYAVTQCMASSQSKMQRETMTSTVDPPIKPIASPPPPRLLATPTSKIEMELPALDEVKLTWAGQIETILEDEAPVKAGEVIVRLGGDKPIEAEITGISNGIKRLDAQIDAITKRRDAAQIAGNMASVAAAEVDLAERQRALAVKKELLATRATDLENFRLHAPSAGTFKPVARPGQKFPAGSVVAKIQREAVPVATFKVADTMLFAANATIAVAVHKGEQRVTCTIAEVQPDHVKIACPVGPPLAEGIDVTIDSRWLSDRLHERT